MSEHDLEPLSPAALALIAAESRRPDGAPDQTSRIFERLATSINVGVGPGGGSGGGSDGGGAGSTLGSAISGKVIAVVLGAFVLGGGAGAALHAQLSSPSAPAAVPSSSAQVTAPASSSAPVVASDLPTIPVGALSEAIPSPSRPPLPAPSETLADRDTSLSRERAVIDRSRMASARHDPASSLAALEEHAREFPRGRLAEEREALAIGALADLGRMTEARERAVRFRAQHPMSVFLPAVAAVLEREKKDSAP